MAEELEPANKMWETWIAISPETLRLSGDKLETRLLDIVEFPHVTIPVYELLGWKKEIFLEFWSGKPIPKLVIEGWERIIPEKLLAYLDYYREHTFVGNGFYDLMMSAFGQQEEPCMEYVKVNDQIEMAGMEKRYQELLKGVDSYGVKVELDDLDLVDRTEMDGLIKAQTEAEEPWRQRINGYLVELKWRTHKVNRFESSVPQSEIDEFNTGIDTLEKNCNCYIKRNKFPIEGDRYGMTFKSHLVQMLPNPSQNLSDEEIATLSQRRDKLTDQLKQAMASFVLKSKAVAPAYHEMMADHCLLGQTKREVCGIFEKGRELYLEQKWDAAKELFQQGLEKVPDDGPCITFINRCDQYKANPPAEGWDGTWEADW
jgi:hypothetical protein